MNTELIKKLGGRIAWLMSLVTSLALLPLQAGEPYAKAPVESVEYAPEGWEFNLGVYGVMAGLDGTLGIGNRSASFESDFGDILSELDFAVFLALEARKNRFSFLNDFWYIGMSPGTNRPGRIYDTVAAEMDMFINTGVATYRFFEKGDSFLELGGGLRLLYLESELSMADTTGRPALILPRIRPRRFAPFVNQTSSNTILDGVGAVRFGYQISERLALRMYGDVGGGDSVMTWQISGNLGYTISDTKTLFVGYRHMDYEFANGRTNLNMSFSGPQIGMVIKF